MCFSPEVSFTAAGVLGITGTACLKNIKSKKEIPLALIPFLFALQQLIEGFVWVVDKPSSVATTLTYGFLFFAYIIWPFWIPMSYFLIEEGVKRKSILLILTAVGSAIATVLLLLLVFQVPQVTLVEGHLKYDIFTPANKHTSLLTGITLNLYAITTCGAGLFTKYRALSLFSILSFIFLIITLINFFQGWQSVWCFFAAILSVVIYFHLNRSKTTIFKSANPL